MPPPPRKKVTRKSKPQEVKSEPSERQEQAEDDGHRDWIKARAKAVKTEIKEEQQQLDASQDKGQESDGSSIDDNIVSSCDSDSESAALKDSDDEDGGAASSLAVIPSLPMRDVAHSRPPPNKKHKCLQSDITTSRAISGADACSPGHPAFLPLQKVKLHYVVHYLHRGAFNHIVPELQGEERDKIEAYECNVCGKKFKNNVTKKEYPARGSFVCHLATEHGKILDAMRDDDTVDMSGVIEILKTYDKQFREFTVTGTKTDKDDKLVTVKESLYFKMQNATAQQQALAGASPSTADGASSSSTGIKPSSFYPQMRHGAGFGGGYFSCPKCDQMKRNRDRASLRIHLFQHYRDRWEDRLNSVAKKDAKEIGCDACKKKVTGATASGVRNSMVCHWAIQHEELKGALADDEKIPKEFVDRLYMDSTPSSTPLAAVPYQRTNTNYTRPEMTAVLSVFDKNHERNHKNFPIHSGRPLGSKNETSGKAGKNRRKKSASFISDDEEDEEEETLADEDEESEGDWSNSNSGDDGKKRRRCKVKSSDAVASSAGQANTSYVRKRTKINFTLDSDEDSDEWSEGKSGKKKARAKKDLNGDLGAVDAGKTRLLPKRASAARAKFVEEDISDEEEI